MEKGTAHYKMARVRELLASGRMRMTRAAFASASGMGLNSHIVRDLLLQLDPRDFYKSMTTYEDHRVWRLYSYHSVRCPVRKTDGDRTRVGCFVQIQIAVDKAKGATR